MRTVAEVRTDVMLAVFADRDRSVERAVDLAIIAGIAHERERMREILEIEVPPARGIERALIIMGLSGSPPEDVRKMVEFLVTNVSSDDLATQRRQEFRAICNADRECQHAG